MGPELGCTFALPLALDPIKRVALLLTAFAAVFAGGAAVAAAYEPPPANGPFDYQIGGDYPLAAAVQVVSRDWFSGQPAPDPVYSICYVNAFQTQANESGTDRPDERSNWPQRPRLSPRSSRTARCRLRRACGPRCR